MAWTIELRPNARTELRKLDKPVQRRLVGYREGRVAASADPRRLGKPLRGDKGDLWSYRVGDYRLVCSLDDRRSVVVVITLGHRRKVYR